MTIKPQNHKYIHQTMNILTQRWNRNQAEINAWVYMVSCLPVIFKAEETPAGETKTKPNMLLS